MCNKCKKCFTFAVTYTIERLQKVCKMPFRLFNTDLSTSFRRVDLCNTSFPPALHLPRSERGVFLLIF